ncbi:hypothetical protein LTR78_010851 [Recurvomyces mirabilis]|uniref:Aminoglycoside phosphotransferase domain-containing protein n=1 Tax=Recurvomyces mirabilis TaxID=574656 RepID=A0AAE0WGN8_9PEZI|nr:hypothetical protein LTR78_010851 [Recurvomyces mirabilis]KAK5150344.1 hypothetical protein LTS14_010183 [Recurvomyces mirabilis]
MEIPDDDEVMQHCLAVDCSKPFYAGTFVTRLRAFAIKYGHVSREEVNNQRHAHDVLNPNIVRVPQVFRYFSAAGKDYLVMEYVEGEPKTVILDDETIDTVARIVNHLHGFTSQQAGPAGGGRCSGTLWPEDEDITMLSSQDIEYTVNSRTSSTSRRFNLGESPLVFTHGDVAPRNILFSRSGIWFLDWEFAGYFPRAAEFAALSQDYGANVEDIRFRQRVLDTLKSTAPLSDNETCQAQLLLEYAFNNIRFAWPRVQSHKSQLGTTRKKRCPIEAERYVDIELELARRIETELAPQNDTH